MPEVESFISFTEKNITEYYVREILKEETSEEKETAEILGRGGAHYTNNPCKDVIINTDEVTRINTVVLPAVFEEIYKILIPAQNNRTIDKKLVDLFIEGNTSKVVDFMLENKIHTDDLKQIDGLTSNDINVIHSAYWERYHKNKKL